MFRLQEVGQSQLESEEAMEKYYSRQTVCLTNRETGRDTSQGTRVGRRKLKRQEHKRYIIQTGRYSAGCAATTSLHVPMHSSLCNVFDYRIGHHVVTGLEV